MKKSLQRISAAIAAIIAPNLFVFLVLGLITALYIPTGWLPNEDLQSLIGPMFISLLPILIGYTGGKLIYGNKGGVIGALVTTAAVVATSSPQIMTAMVIGPAAAWVLKKIDGKLHNTIFERFDVYLLGILGWFLSALVYLFVPPILHSISELLASVTDTLVHSSFGSLAAIPIEIGKILFLNTFINSYVIEPLGAEQAAATGQSIFYLLETNPGAGLGLLIAYTIAGSGVWRRLAPGAMVIHFLGGIHEIYFPYVLAKPIMFIALWAGNIAANLWFIVTGAGLVAPPSPGSIFAYIGLLPPGGTFAVLGGVVIATIVTAIVGVILLKKFPIKNIP